MCSIWSTKICFESKRRRPISVDLPSSTEPAVTSLSSSALKVTDTLAVLHRRLAHAVVGARLAALGHARCRDLGDDLLDRCRIGQHTAGAGHVADRAEAHRCGERLLGGIAAD